MVALRWKSTILAAFVAWTSMRYRHAGALLLDGVVVLAGRVAAAEEGAGARCPAVHGLRFLPRSA
jgi:hypothetical protein